MGSGIGQVMATAYEVTIVDVNDDLTRKAMDRIEASLNALDGEGILPARPSEILRRIRTSTNIPDSVRDAEVVVEAVYEDLTVKKKIFEAIDKNAESRCIMASNTSSLPISMIASATRHPDRVIGTHFWNPPYLMAAVEVVRGDMTSEETVRRTVELMQHVGKKPAVVRKDVPGQIGIRILYAMIREATWLVENGVASPGDIDGVVREALGTRLAVLGPLELADLSGIDLVYSVAKGLYGSLDSSSVPHHSIQAMIARGETGAKAGRGFYDWRSDRDMTTTIKMRDEYLVKLLREKRNHGRMAD